MVTAWEAREIQSERRIPKRCGMECSPALPVEVHVLKAYRTSNPRSQNRTAAPSTRAGASSRPATAIHAPIGSKADGKTEERMGQEREPLCVGIEENDGERDRREIEGKRVQHVGRDDQHERRDRGEQDDLAGRDQTQRKGARTFVRGILGIEGAVRPPVEAHCRGPGADHGHGDPEEGPPGRQPVGGEQGAGEGEGQRKYRYVRT